MKVFSRNITWSYKEKKKTKTSCFSKTKMHEAVIAHICEVDFAMAKIWVPQSNFEVKDVPNILKISLLP